MILGQLDGGSKSCCQLLTPRISTFDRIGELKSGDAWLQNTSRLAVVAGVGNGFRLWRKLIFVDVLASWNKCPAAAIGLSLLSVSRMAEVLRKLGADKVRVKWPNDPLSAGSQAGRHSCGANWQNRRCGAKSLVPINMAMRRVEEEVLIRWIALQRNQLDRNTLAAMLIRELRAASGTLQQEGLAPYLRAGKAG